MAWSKDVKFHPWIGKFYKKQDIKILILGESHYDWRENGRLYRSKGVNFTQDYIKFLINFDDRIEYGNKATFTKLEKAFIGDKDYTRDNVIQFWNKVAFYNYVQKSVPSGARVKPLDVDFENAAKPFFEVINCLKPHVIVVLGIRLWNNLPETDPHFGKPFFVEKKEIQTCNYKYKFGSCYAFPIYHPSSGFTPTYWYKVIKRGIGKV